MPRGAPGRGKGMVPAIEQENNPIVRFRNGPVNLCVALTRKPSCRLTVVADGYDAAGHDPEDEDDAARAFEALRGEVAALRHGIELVYRQGQQAPAALDAPDYSPTLGAIAQELSAFGKRLDGMEAHPALQLTPAAYATQVTAGVRRVEDETARSPDARAGAVPRWAARAAQPDRFGAQPVRAAAAGVDRGRDRRGVGISWCGGRWHS